MVEKCKAAPVEARTRISAEAKMLRRESAELRAKAQQFAKDASVEVGKLMGAADAKEAEAQRLQLALDDKSVEWGGPKAAAKKAGGKAAKGK